MSTDKPNAGNPANRLGLDYRDPPPRKTDVPIIDIHTHLYDHPPTGLFIEAADLYGVERIVSMTPLADVEAIRARLGRRVEFIAIPNWKELSAKEPFRAQWIRDLHSFRAHGARICKLWMAPRLRKEHGLTADHPFLRPVIDAALELGYDFMIHAADPSPWFERDDKYADRSVYGTKPQQYQQVEWLLAYAAPRRVIGAHLGGYPEDPAFLQGLLDRHANYYLDTSATKWIVRALAPQPQAVHDFIVRNADRILFGSDLVANKKYDGFEHYASRYWCHRTMWETPYRGESPIEDPDAPDPPQLAGVDLPADVLKRIYRANALRLAFAADVLP